MKTQTSKSQYVIIFADLFSSTDTENDFSIIARQFSDVYSRAKSMLKNTYDFYAKFIDRSNIYIASSSDFNDLSRSQLKNVDPENFLVLPDIKNPASSMAYLAFKLFKLNNESNIIFSPCDIASEDEPGLIDTMCQALMHTSSSEALIVLGSKTTNFQAKTEYFETQITSNLNQLYSICGMKICNNSKSPMVSSDKKSFFLNSKVIIGKSLELLDMYREHGVEDFIAFHGIYKDLNTDREREAVAYAFLNCRSIPFENLLLKNVKNLWLKEVKMNVVNPNLFKTNWSLFNMNTPKLAGYQN